MPLYEYACEACGRREEKLQSMSAPGAHDCPACGRLEGMRRQFSAAAVAVSGGGAPAAAGPACATGACPFARG